MPAQAFTLLTAEECAARLRISVERWNEISADEPVPALLHHHGIPRWADWQIHSLRPPRPRRKKKRQPVPTGMWTVRQAARHARLAPGTFAQYARDGRAPAPAGRQGNRDYWQPDAVRAYTAGRRPPQTEPATPERQRITGPPTPDAPLWTARQCADHHGVSTRVRLAAVAHNDAPAHVETTGKATPLWSAMAVRNTTIE
ncbi:hypothetical protein AB0E08_08260 [Streptomyces sp. NPDC048281]|uniref:hypothetical protein n=1 Tax=Streptomyces sp. NPDC048281 TaxID=3154715 RepID=UPI0034204DBD